MRRGGSGVGEAQALCVGACVGTRKTMQENDVDLELINIFEKATQGPQTTSCLDDNTAYYGNNLNSPWNTRNRGIDDVKGSSSECQRACANHPRCNFWSWHKDGLGWCYLKRSKPTYHPVYGAVYVGNNRHYVSGPKHCSHVS